MISVLVAVALGAEPVCGGEGTLVGAADEVVRAWMQADGQGFQLARAELAESLACAGEVVPAADAARVHRAEAIAAFVEGDMEAARRAFVAVRTLDPAWAPPADLVPEGHPLWKVFTSAEPPPAPRSVAFRALPEHGWAIDGARFPLSREALGSRTPAYGLPADRAFVLQVLDASGRPTYSGYHLSTSSVPVTELSLAPDPAVLRAKRQKQARIWGSVVGGALLAGGGASFGVAWTQREAIEGGDVPLVDVEAAAAEANTLGGVSYGLAGAGALLVTLAWSVPW